MLHWGISPPHYLRFSISAFRVIIVSQFRRSEPPSSQFWRSKPPSSQFRCSEPSSFLSFGFQSYHLLSFSVQSLHFSLVWRSEPPFLSSSGFRSIISLQFGVQSRIFDFGIQGHHFFQFGFQSRILSFGIQSHHRFSVSKFRATIFSISAFRTIIVSQFQRSEPSFFSNSVFKATISPIFSVQSHHLFLVQRLEPSSLSSLAFRAVSSVSAFRATILFSLALRATFSVLAFTAIIVYQFRCSKPSSFLSFGVPSHHLSLFRRLEPSFSSSLAFRATISPQFSIQSHHFLQFGVQSDIFSLAFRSFIFLQFRCSEPSSVSSLAFRAASSILGFRVTIPFSFGIQSRIFSSVFRAMFSVWHSEPPSLLSYNVQSRPSQFDIQRRQFSVTAFRAFTLLSSTFRAMISVWHSESHLQLSVLSHYLFTIWRSQPSSYHNRAFVATLFGVQSYIQAFRTIISPQLGIQSHRLHSGIQSHRSHSGVQNHRSHSAVQSHHPHLGVQSHSSHLGVQSHHFSFFLAFRVIFPQPCHSQSWLLTSIFTSITHPWFFLTSLTCAYHLFIMLFQTSPSPTHDMVH